MKKNRTINVNNLPISICEQNSEDYISITDMLKAKEGDFFISDWLRNRNTVEFLGIWETLNNPNFNYGEFAVIKSEAGLNSYKISVKEWTEKTGAIGLCAKSGRYGGTYAHKDIAFEFGTWISPHFKLYLIKEFQRLKEEEGNVHHIEWDYRRSLAATNYHVHTDAIKENLIPWAYVKQKPESIIYAEEADIINLALFGLTAKQWREKYPEESNVCKTIRDCADTNKLIVLSNLESMNAMLIRAGEDKKKRFEILRGEALHQLESLNKLTKDLSLIQSPNKKKIDAIAPLESNDNQMSFADAIKKIANAGKPNT